MPAPLSSTHYLDRAFQESRHHPPAFSLPRQGQATSDRAMNILPTSQLLIDADSLLNDASLKVQKLGNTLSPENYNRAQGLLEYAKDFRAGLENKDMFSRHQQAQEYLKKAKETHQEVVQLTMGPY